MIYAGESGCFTSSVTMHEIGHTMGAVQRDAPTATPMWHCSAAPGADVMCYLDGTTAATSALTRCTETGPFQRFDCSFNIYFDTAESLEPYLGSHWNLGGPENRFLWRGY